MISLIVAIAVVALLVWLFSLTPFPAVFKKIVLIVGVLIVVLLVLKAFGLLDGVNDINLPRIR